jgi:ubiquitin carboxyl-terminal hydrolase 1
MVKEFFDQPPQVLALHINRSIHYGQYVAKNPIRLIFPEFLDLTPYTTSGNLSTVPSVPISSPPPRSATPTPATYALTRTIYRLSSVVCHYGQHSFGHYVCFRRKPRPTGTGTGLDPPRLGEGSNKEDVRSWLRVSDNSVKECTTADVLAEGVGAFMLYYERVVQERRGLSPRSSEETLRPDMKWGNGSTTSLASVSDGNLSSSPGSSVGLSVSFTEGDGRRKTKGPRVVRSVAPNRGRSMSVPPPSSDANGFARPALNGDAKQKRRFSPQTNGSHLSSLEPDKSVDGDHTPPHSPTSLSPPSSLRHKASSQSLHARIQLPPEAVEA